VIKRSAEGRSLLFRIAYPARTSLLILPYPYYQSVLDAESFRAFHDDRIGALWLHSSPTAGTLMT